MKGIRSVVSKKVQVSLTIWLLVVFGAIYGVFFALGESLMPIEYILGLAVLALIITLIVLQTVFSKPLKLILKQIKSLLTGRKYKKIYTDRTDEIGVIAHFFNEVTTSFERVSDQIREGKKVTGELLHAGQLQKELMPLTPPTVDGFDIAVKNRSAEELGGDNLDFIQVKDNTLFYVGDVTGHGVPAAIIMTMVNTLINAYAELYDTAYEVVVQTNRRLKNRIRATMFMSMLMLKWDAVDKKMTYVGCGHEHLVIYRAATGKCDVKKSGGIALGMVPDVSKIVKEKEIELNEGDVIIMYTDGITEAKNMEGEMFTLERLQEKVILYGSENDAETIVANIARDFSAFVEEHVQEDDVTLMAIKYLGHGKEGKTTMDQKQERWSAESEEAHEKTEADDKVGLADIKSKLNN